MDLTVAWVVKRYGMVVLPKLSSPSPHFCSLGGRVGVTISRKVIMFCQNICIFSGRLGDAPNPKEIGNSIVWKVGLAVDSPRKTDDGWENQTSWVDLEYWENPDKAGLGNTLRKLEKGDVVHVHTTYRKTTRETDDGNRSYINFRITQLYPEQKPRTEGKSSEKDEMPY